MLAAEIRRAVAALPISLLAQAEVALVEVRAGLTEAARGSIAPELTDAAQTMTQALDAVARYQQTMAEVAQIFERYLAQLGVAGTSPTPSTTAVPATVSPPARPALSPFARELVAQVQRRGDKISPEKMVRISKDTTGKLVWLELGDENAGLTHLHGDKRLAEFERAGIGKDEIVDVVFSALERKTPIGVTGRDRPVYEIVRRGQLMRIAVSVGSNGFIVGANPVSLNRKVKPLP
ncbi:MAG: hypothetical protein M3548_21020 [Actinomycetota bacterium]|nr:hypothetical protein [Actinomycetota bacterium]